MQPATQANLQPRPERHRTCSLVAGNQSNLLHPHAVSIDLLTYHMRVLKKVERAFFDILCRQFHFLIQDEKFLWRVVTKVTTVS